MQRIYPPPPDMCFPSQNLESRINTEARLLLHSSSDGLFHQTSTTPRPRHYQPYLSTQDLMRIYSNVHNRSTICIKMENRNCWKDRCHNSLEPLRFLKSRGLYQLLSNLSSLYPSSRAQPSYNSRFHLVVQLSSPGPICSCCIMGPIEVLASWCCPLMCAQTNSMLWWQYFLSCPVRSHIDHPRIPGMQRLVELCMYFLPLFSTCPISMHCFIYLHWIWKIFVVIMYGTIATLLEAKLTQVYI